MKYLIVVEKTNTGFSSYSPDLDGCIATGSSEVEVEELMKGAIEFHLEGLQQDEVTPPLPHAYSSYIEVAA